MTKGELRNEWTARMAEFKNSGQSQATWCREKNINLRTFNYWYCKFKNADELADKPTNWLPMKLEKTFEKSEVSAINIKLGNATIEIKPGFDSEHLLKVVRTLNSLC